MHKRQPLAAVSNLYHCTADNIGDLMCGAGQYLWPDLSHDLPMGPVGKSIDNVIIGGGQLFSQLNTIISSIYRYNPKSKTIAWGVGLPPAGIRDKSVSEVAQRFSLFGTRNYDRREQLTFVPCASCLSPIFDQVTQPKHELVFYLHRRKGTLINVPSDAPVMTNARRPPEDAINFIASGETVVTSSYHGVYWAQLLGRRAICLPYNNKFDTFEHRPTMAEANDWRSLAGSASRTRPLLDEYRDLNHNFAQRALEIWNG